MQPTFQSKIIVSQFCRDSFFKHNPTINENEVLIKLLRAIGEGAIRLPAEHRQDGHVWLVAISPVGFTSRVKELEEGDYLFGRYKPRVEGETPRKSINVLAGQPVPAKSVDVVLYSEQALCEDPDHVKQDADFEIVTILAKACEGDEPMDTDTLLHNHFLSDGGTATGMSDAEFVAALKRSHEYWKNHARIY